MKDTEYVTAVARVRVNENKFLTDDDIQRLVQSKNTDEIRSVLQEKGLLSAGEEIEKALSSIVYNAVALIKEVAPDPDEFLFLTVKNDFHNLKTVLKGIITDVDYNDYLIYPNTVSPELLEKAVKEKKFSVLPEYMAKSAEKAYSLFVTTADGQLSDICIDKASLETVINLSENNDDKFISDLGELMTATANMRIAVRSSLTNRSEDLIKDSLCRQRSLDIDALAKSASIGLEELKQFIASSKYSYAAEYLSKSVADFEKWCDNSLIEFVRSSKYTGFGPAPLAAYIIKAEAMQKTVRIILSCKEIGLSEKEIRERIRLVY